MKLATWNVNSLKVRLPHLTDWVLAAQPDVTDVVLAPPPSKTAAKVPD